MRHRWALTLVLSALCFVSVSAKPRDISLEFYVTPANAPVMIEGFNAQADSPGHYVRVAKPEELKSDPTFSVAAEGYYSERVTFNAEQAKSQGQAICKVSLRPSSVRTWISMHPVVSALGLFVGGGLAAYGGWHALQLRERRRRFGLLEELVDKKAAEMDSVIGSRLDSGNGQYRVLRKLGSGGMATVYRAVPDATLDLRNSVAIKVISPEALDAENLKRFQREIVVSKDLSHPNVMRILDWAFAPEGFSYLVMEFVDGRTLSSLIPSQGLALPLAAPIVGDIFLGLCYAHDLKLLHRDLKPENVMVTKAGQVKLMDFGIAKRVDLGDQPQGKVHQITAAGSAMGTPHYMAPETVQPSFGSPGPASDQYAMGILIYEMLSGRRPFEDPDPLQVIFQHINSPLPSLQAAAPGLPLDVCSAVERMLAKRPEQRFASLREAGEAFMRAAGRDWPGSGKSMGVPPELLV